MNACTLCLFAKIKILGICHLLCFDSPCSWSDHIERRVSVVIQVRAYIFDDVLWFQFSDFRK